MPADALFEVMAGCVARGGRWPDAATKGARFGKRPLQRETQEGGLRPPLQRQESHFNRETVSTTEFRSFVVENRGEKRALKVLVESLLLAFCTKCRRADIFHRIANRAASVGDLTVVSEQQSRFSSEFCSGRLPRRAPFHQSKSK
jgi:hypothetical protein